MYNEALSEQLAVVATIDPDAYGTGDQTTDIIDMKLHRRVLFIILGGTLGTVATLDFLVKGSASSNMASPSNLTGKAVTQLTEAGTDSDKQALVEVTAEEVAAQGFRYIQGTASLAAATSDYGLVAIADFSRYSTADENDLASVDEIVT